MDVTTAPRPHSTPRPTQAYYVPRKLLECGRGQAKSPTSPVEEKTTTPSAPCKKPVSKPRPLMEQIIPPTPSLKEKSKNIFNMEKRNNFNNNNNNNNTKNNNNNNNNNSNSNKSNRGARAAQEKSRRSTTPRELHIASTPSSRSSSSMSQLSPTTPNSLTVSTPRVVHVKGTPKKYTTSPFAAIVAQSPENVCVCERRNCHVVCKRCGYECVGRVQIVCSVHPLVLSLNDLRECPNPICRSIQISELSADVDSELAEPIENINLLAIDD
ncbi:unnamed protein product [Caenorhabditis bovis]|uniref:Uncharacterized protein n=1 Tax=Caenorhabditis bovis TaxID=2654633 RepID=A0A8S1EQE7_9PELO|nr:unnamed protein product [Caenorhabditis bovis]